MINLIGWKSDYIAAVVSTGLKHGRIQNYLSFPVPSNFSIMHFGGSAQKYARDQEAAYGFPKGPYAEIHKRIFILSNNVLCRAANAL